jgi:TRAP-type C4-dicarboxylate transport system permease large subunit
MGIFNSLVYAIKELMGTILIISVITAMSKELLSSGINETMVSPFTKLIRGPALAYWVIGIVMMIISWFFWPSPAVALLGAVLLPVALRVKLPAMGVAVAMNLFGHGIALSGDFVIQGAPRLTADGAGIPVGDVVQASIPLVIVMGIVTTVAAFWFIFRDIKKNTLKVENVVEVDKEDILINEVKIKVQLLSPKLKYFLAILVPVLFLMDIIIIMFIAKLQGGDATALIGGTALFILILVTFFTHKKRSLENITTRFIEGLQFGFRVFGPVIPIAAFFYLGDSGFNSSFGELLPKGSNGLVNDLGVALAR